MNWIASMGLAAGLIGCTKPTTSSQFEALFSSLSVGVPEYQTIQNFFQTADAVKGNSFYADFTQSSTEFAHFMEQLGLSEGEARSPLGATGIKANSTVNSEQRWLLNVKVEGVEPTANIYRVHVDGRQPYD